MFKFNNVEFPTFNQTNETLWEGLKTGRYEPTNYQIWFVVRRLFTAIIIVIPPQMNCQPVFQYQVLIYVNLYFAAKVKVDKPYLKNGVNKMEFINECYMLLVVYLLYAMSVEAHTGLTSVHMKNQLGISVNSVIILMIASNALFIAVEILFVAIREGKRRCNIFFEKRRLTEERDKIQKDIELGVASKD